MVERQLIDMCTCGHPVAFHHSLIPITIAGFLQCNHKDCDCERFAFDGFDQEGINAIMQINELYTPFLLTDMYTIPFDSKTVAEQAVIMKNLVSVKLSEYFDQKFKLIDTPLRSVTNKLVMERRAIFELKIDHPIRKTVMQGEYMLGLLGATLLKFFSEKISNN